MSKEPLKKLIKRIEEEPESCLMLGNAIEVNKKQTLETFYFTPIIEEYFESVLEKVAQSAGGGFWVQAEYGAGKTHFLSTISILLMDTTEENWSFIKNEKIHNYIRRLKNKKLLPVLINLKGQAGDSLLNIILENIEQSLEKCGLENKIAINKDDNVIIWYENNKIKNTINEFILSKHLDINKLTTKEKALLIQEFCKENKINPNIPKKTSEIIKNIYLQLRENKYFDGMLFIIDEYAGWQMLHVKGSKEYALDEEILETLAWILPKSEDLEIYSFIASTYSTPTKLMERFTNILLLKKEDDYGVITSYRVRNINQSALEDIEHYYEYYFKNFKFLKNISKENFIETFPFHPKLFEILRKIAARELPAVRLGINVVWDILIDELLDNNRMIIANDLFYSSNFIEALNTEEYKKAFEVFQEAENLLVDLDFEESTLNEAKILLKVIFLSYLANKDTTVYLNELELKEMILLEDTYLKAEDEVKLILTKLKDLTQIEYIKEKGVTFKPDKILNKGPNIFANIRRKCSNEYQILKYWEKSLTLTVADTGSSDQGFFHSFNYDIPIGFDCDSRKINYRGTAILTSEWKVDYGEKITGNEHFRIIFLTKSTSDIDFNLRDESIAVCVPKELTESAKDLARDYWAISDMEEEYENKGGSEASTILEWVVTKKREIVGNLVNKQRGIYASSEIISLKGIAFDTKQIFYTIDLSKNCIQKIASSLLNTAYSKLPIDSNSFNKNLESGDVKKIFEGLFEGASGFAARSACNNFCPGLHLSKSSSACEFDPHLENKVFDIINDKLIENNKALPLWKLYDFLQEPPYGLTREIITLFLLAFVIKDSPRVDIILKNEKLNVSKITSQNIRSIGYKPKMDDLFDELIEGIGKTWQEVLPFTRLINPELKLVTKSNEVEEQEIILLASLKKLYDEISQIYPKLDSFLPIFLNENNRSLLDSYNSLLNFLKEVSESTSFTIFYENIVDKYPSIEQFKDVLKKYNNLQRIFEKKDQIISLKLYLDNSIIPSDNELYKIKKELSLNIGNTEIFNNPKILDNVLEELIKFKQKYIEKYKVHHIDYYKKIIEFKNIIEGFKNQVNFLENLLDKKYLYSGNESFLLNKYYQLEKELFICANDLKNVENNPICENCQISLAANVLEFSEDIENLSKSLAREIYNKKSILKSYLKQIVELDELKKIKKLEVLLDDENINNLLNFLTRENIDYISTLIDKSNIVTIQKNILGNIDSKFSIIEDKNLDDFIRELRNKILSIFEKEKKNNPNKSIKLKIF